MAERKYTHPGSGDTTDAEAKRLGMVDTETNGQPVRLAKKSDAIRRIDGFLGNAGDQPEKIAKEMLDNCAASIASLLLNLATAREITRKAYEGHGIPVPAWLNINVSVAGKPLIGEQEAKEPTIELSKPRRGPGRPKNVKPEPDPVEEESPKESSITNSTFIQPLPNQASFLPDENGNMNEGNFEAVETESHADFNRPPSSETQGYEPGESGSDTGNDTESGHIESV